MPSAKYKKVFDDMLTENQEVFDNFKAIHDLFDKDSSANIKEFNRQGLPIMDIIREYEDMLCNYSEGGKFGKYSLKLSEKFWELIRSKFPRIDEVGVE
jgi:hypothetical protein